MKNKIELYKHGRLGEKQTEIEEFKLIEKTKQTYSQDWTAYNKAQSKEKLLVMNILDELLCYVDFPARKGSGRNPIPMRDKIFYSVTQAYNEKSSRRCISDLEIARRLNFVEKTPHFNTLLKCLRDPSMTPYLQHLISVSGMPLQQVETDFAVDSSGFSTSQFGRWFDVRLGELSEKRKFMKVHLTCGVKTNIIAAANITGGNSSDCTEFSNLIKQTNKIYKIREVSADKAYSSKSNMETVEQFGGVPFIVFKKNATGRAKGCSIWKRMYWLYSEHNEEFMEHYHKRSNSESVFHMLKVKFGSYLRSKTETAKINEVLARCLCHNLCVLVQEAFETGIDLDFKKCAEIPVAHKQD